MSEPHIFVATPLGKNGMLHIGTASFCASVNAYPNIEWGFTMTHSPEMSRNVLIERRLKEDNGKTTHFLFLDSDVVPPKDMLQAMLAHDADFVTAITPLFFDMKMVWNVAIPNTDKWFMMSNELPDKPFYTEKCGGGAVLVKRKVLEDIGWPYFHTEYQPLDEKNIAIKCGEDVWLCVKAREKGYKILVDPNLVCHHYNQVDLIDIYNSIAAQIEARITQKDKIESHLDALTMTVQKCSGDVIEFGSGNGSTPHLHLLCGKLNKKLISYENNKEWYERSKRFECEFHKVVLVDNYDQIEVPENIGVAFVDSEPANSRSPLIERFKDSEYVVVHDTEDSLYGYDKTFDQFSNRFDYKDKCPWTTILSNKNKLDFIKGN